MPLDRLVEGEAIVVEATTAELGPVARRLGIPALRSLRCSWTLRSRRGTGQWDADGSLQAVLTRECVVTLDPFETEFSDAFAVRFVPEEDLPDEINPDAPDEIPFDGRAIDLGEATVEQLALALDPFPRAPGAVLPEGAEDPAGEGSPFAVLRGRSRRN